MRAINYIGIITVVLLVSGVHSGVAQSNETLTNTTVLKMVRAHLSDDLIIDEISNATVNFNLAPDSVTYLLNEHVSREIINAMTDAQLKQHPVATVPNPVPPPVTVPSPVAVPESKPDPIPEASNSSISEKPAGNTVTAISYVVPLKDLFIFFDARVAALNAYMQKWDEKIRKSLDDEKQLHESMLLMQADLTGKKNISAKPFDNDILSHKAKLAKYREEHELLKEKIRVEGKELAEDLKTMSNDQVNLVGNTFIEINKNIKKVNVDPAVGEFPEQIVIPEPEITANLIVHTEPLKVIPACYRNEIRSLKDTVILWTEKARVVIQRDAALKKQLEPLNTQLAQYLSQSKENQKLNKTDIAALKKQCDNLLNERKDLFRKMEKDRDILTSNMTRLRDELISVLTERYLDAIENVEFSYQDKF